MPKKLLYFFSLSILFLFLSALPISATEKEDTVSVNVFNNMYYGTLEKINDCESVFSLFSDQSDSTSAGSHSLSDVRTAAHPVQGKQRKRESLRSVPESLRRYIH